MLDGAGDNGGRQNNGSQYNQSQGRQNNGSQYNNAPAPQNQGQYNQPPQGNQQFNNNMTSNGHGGSSAPLDDDIPFAPFYGGE